MTFSARRDWLCLLAIVACGFALRVWGIGFGFPLLSNLYIRPDESLIVASAAGFWENGGHPGFFAYPALMMEICAVLFLPWSLSSDGIAGAFSRDPSALFLAARWVSVVAGTASIPLVFVVARRLAGVSAGLAAGALFAMAPLAVRDSHFGVTDTLQVFLLLASLAWPLRSAGARDFAITGLLFGLACATKYPAILMAPAIGLRIVLHSPASFRSAVRNLAHSAAACSVVFALLNPFLFLAQGKSSGEVMGILGVLYRLQSGDSAWNASDSLLQILRPLRHGPGGYVGLALAAIPLLTSPRTALAPVALAIGGFAAALLPFQHTVPYRYALPILPFIAILAGCAIAQLKRPVLQWAVVVALILPGVWDCLWINRILSRTDTRTLASDWITTHVPANVPVVLLGPPECEPQMLESTSSIQRRIRYVHELYGQASGDIVSIPYNMMLKAAQSFGPVREVYRGASAAEQAPGDTILIVTPSSPLELVRKLEPFQVSKSGTILKSVEISGTHNSKHLEYDQIDAFFLPFRTFDSVIRPGPTLRMELVRR